MWWGGGGDSLGYVRQTDATQTDTQFRVKFVLEGGDPGETKVFTGIWVQGVGGWDERHRPPRKHILPRALGQSRSRSNLVCGSYAQSNKVTDGQTNREILKCCSVQTQTNRDRKGDRDI